MLDARFLMIKISGDNKASIRAIKKDKSTNESFPF